MSCSRYQIRNEPGAVAANNVGNNRGTFGGLVLLKSSWAIVLGIAVLSSTIACRKPGMPLVV